MLSWITGLWTAGKTLLGGKSLALYLGIALAFAALLCWGLWLKADLADARGNIAVLETANVASRETIQNLVDGKKRLNSSLAHREAKINTINAQREALRRKLGEVMRNDQDFAAWAAAPVPGALPGLFQ